MKEKFNLAAVIEELEAQKRMIISVVQIEENIDENEVKMKARVVKLKVMEELEVIQQMLNDLDDKIKEAADPSQDDLQESWKAAKKVMANAEDKVAEIFKK